MIERTDDGFEVACDYCSADTEVEGYDWQEMLAEVKSGGWHIRKLGEGWKHMCDDCWTRHARW